MALTITSAAGQGTQEAPAQLPLQTLENTAQEDEDEDEEELDEYPSPSPYVPFTPPSIPLCTCT